MFLLFLKNYATFFKSKLNLFKQDFVLVTDEFIKFQNKKNANYTQIFVKSNQIYSISREKLNCFISNEQDREMIFSFLASIGQNDYEYENNKISNFLLFLEEKLKIYNSNIKLKGELTLKVLVCIGMVLAILVWWKYGCVYFI